MRLDARKFACLSAREAFLCDERVADGNRTADIEAKREHKFQRRGDAAPSCLFLSRCPTPSGAQLCAPWAPRRLLLVLRRWSLTECDRPLTPEDTKSKGNSVCIPCNDSSLLCRWPQYDQGVLSSSAPSCTLQMFGCKEPEMYKCAAESTSETLTCWSRQKQKVTSTIIAP